MRRLPVWEENPNPGIFTHVSWAAKEIMESGPRLPVGSDESFPYEGLAFAVSLNPYAWAKIARIGTTAPVVVLKFERPALDYYEWRGERHLEDVGEVARWGVKNGWITQGKDVLVWSWVGDENGDPVKVFSRHPIEAEEAWKPECEGDSFIRAEKVAGWRPTQRLRERVFRHYPGTRDGHMNVEVFNLWLASEHPEFGMVWYAEELDPMNYSAPRGAILPPYFGEVRPIRLSTAEAEEPEEGFL